MICYSNFLVIQNISVPDTGIEPVTFWTPLRRCSHLTTKELSKHDGNLNGDVLRKTKVVHAKQREWIIFIPNAINLRTTDNSLTTYDTYVVRVSQIWNTLPDELRKLPDTVFLYKNLIIIKMYLFSVLLSYHIDFRRR